MEKHTISHDDFPLTDGHPSVERADNEFNENALLAALRESQAAFQTAEPGLELEPVVPVENTEYIEEKPHFIPIVDNIEDTLPVVPNFLAHMEEDAPKDEPETPETTEAPQTSPKQTLFQSLELEIDPDFKPESLFKSIDSTRPFSYDPSQQLASASAQTQWLTPEQEKQKLEELAFLAKEGFNCIQQALRQGDTTTALELAEAFRTMPNYYDAHAVALLIERLGVICYSNYYIARILNPHILQLAQ